MRPGRELDARVAQEIFGYEVYAKNKVLHEKTPQGERPLKTYSRDMEWAWPVAERLRISLIPTEGSYWFAFAGPHDGWQSPAEFLQYLEDGDFSLCGASVDENPAKAICEAALKVVEKRREQDLEFGESKGEEGSEAVGVLVETPQVLN